MTAAPFGVTDAGRAGGLRWPGRAQPPPRRTRHAPRPARPCAARTSAAARAARRPRSWARAASRSAWARRSRPTSLRPRNGDQRTTNPAVQWRGPLATARSHRHASRDCRRRRRDGSHWLRARRTFASPRAEPGSQRGEIGPLQAVRRLRLDQGERVGQLHRRARLPPEETPGGDRRTPCGRRSPSASAASSSLTRLRASCSSTTVTTPFAAQLLHLGERLSGLGERLLQHPDPVRG